MSDIFQEVDEEVRSDRFKAYWQAYGSYIIATAVLIILITSGRVIWQDYVQSRAERESESLAAAFQLEEAGNASAAIIAYQALADKATDGVSVLARLRTAGLLVKSGNADEAIALYDALSNDSAASVEMRDLASLNVAALMMDRDPSDDVRARLEKLAVDGGAWKSSAKELLGLMAFREGDYAQARILFDGLLADENTPRAMRTRAAAFSTMLEGKSPMTKTEEPAAGTEG